MAGETKPALVLEAVAAQLGLSIAPPWRDEILFHMTVLAEAAALVTAFPLDDDSEPAPIFRP